MTIRAAVIGAGSWGTTLADVLARAGKPVRIWAREPEVVEGINRRHENVLFLPGAGLHENIEATGDLETVTEGADLVVSAAPSHAVREVMRGAAVSLAPEAVVASVSKGLEPDTLFTMSRVLSEELPNPRRVAVLSGPSFAREVFDRQPTAVVAAAEDIAVAEKAQSWISTSHFRVYTQTDVIGVELGGALKNVVAIAAGMLDGLGLGYNTRAALITRGLAETTRLAVTLGGNPMTLAGLAGLGDLVLTATGSTSRNRSLGVELATGKTLEQVLNERRTVAEGVKTARAAVTLGQRHGVELPIAEKVAEVLFEEKDVRDAIRELMERELKPEIGQ